MTGLDILAWVVMIILVGVVVLVFWLMGSMPGYVARRRRHPWAEALNVAGWIVPNVAGEVIEVAATPNVPLKQGDVLFKIDPTPYDAQVKAIEAQLKLATTRLGQMTTLVGHDAGRGFDVEQRQSEVDRFKAQLENARWNLDKTVVRAPADGYVTNVALRKGAMIRRVLLRQVAILDYVNPFWGAP